MIKTGEALTLDKDEAYQLRELLDLLNDFSVGREIAEADIPEIREAVWTGTAPPPRATTRKPTSWKLRLKRRAD